MNKKDEPETPTPEKPAPEKPAKAAEPPVDPDEAAKTAAVNAANPVK